MGKNKKIKVKEPIPYTEAERSRKITTILIQLSQLNLEHVLTEEMHHHIQTFIKTGKSYDEILDLPQYSRTLEIHLENDKRQQTYINIKFNKIRIEGEGDKNPINKLNTIQEELFYGSNI
jgi:hypothetical protein